MNDFFGTFKRRLSFENKGKNNEKKDSYCIFFISCFIDDLWALNISLKSKDNEMKVENLFEKKYSFNNKKFGAKVYKINIKNNKKLNLFLISSDNKYTWDLNEIELGEKRVIFNDLEINPRYYEHLLKYINVNNNNDKTIISYNLDNFEKLNLFLEFFEFIYLDFLKQNNNNFDKIVQKNLVETFIEISKVKNEFLYSFIIQIFNFSFGTETIDTFLDIFEKLNIQLDDKIENNIFNFFLDIYKNNYNIFLEKFKQPIENKQNIQIEKYIISLDNFMAIYQLLYEDPSKIEKQKLINIKPIIIKLINNKKEIIKKLSFIIFKYNSIYTLFTAEEKELFEFTYETIPNYFDFEYFKTFYKLILQEEEKYGVIVNFSKI